MKRQPRSLKGPRRTAAERSRRSFAASDESFSSAVANCVRQLPIRAVLEGIIGQVLLSASDDATTYGQCAFGQSDGGHGDGARGTIAGKTAPTAAGANKVAKTSCGRRLECGIRGLHDDSTDGTTEGNAGICGADHFKCRNPIGPVRDLAAGHEQVMVPEHPKELVPGVPWPEWHVASSSTIKATWPPPPVLSSAARSASSEAVEVATPTGQEEESEIGSPGLWFPSCLSSRQRAMVHDAARELCLGYGLVGESAERQVIVWEPTAGLVRPWQPSVGKATANISAEIGDRRSGRGGSTVDLTRKTGTTTGTTMVVDTHSVDTTMAATMSARERAVVETRMPMLAESGPCGRGGAGAADGRPKDEAVKPVGTGACDTPVDTAVVSARTEGAVAADESEVLLIPPSSTFEGGMRTLGGEATSGADPVCSAQNGDSLTIEASVDAPMPAPEDLVQSLATPAAMASVATTMPQRAEAEGVAGGSDADGRPQGNACCSVLSTDYDGPLKGISLCPTARACSPLSTDLPPRLSPPEKPVTENTKAALSPLTVVDDNDSDNVCFVVVGAVDGVSEEIVDIDTWETQRVVVEVKNRMSRASNPPPLYDQIQLVVSVGNDLFLLFSWQYIFFLLRDSSWVGGRGKCRGGNILLVMPLPPLPTSQENAIQPYNCVLLAFSGLKIPCKKRVPFYASYAQSVVHNDRP